MTLLAWYLVKGDYSLVFLVVRLAQSATSPFFGSANLHSLCFRLVALLDLDFFNPFRLDFNVQTFCHFPARTVERFAAAAVFEDFLFGCVLTWIPRLIASSSSPSVLSLFFPIIPIIVTTSMFLEGDTLLGKQTFVALHKHKTPLLSV